MANEIDSASDLIDIRDLIERFEELQEEREGLESNVNEAEGTLAEATEAVVAAVADHTDEASDATAAAVAAAKEAQDEAAGELVDARKALDSWSADYFEEFSKLAEFLDECAGNGGDHKWRGRWYPVTFVADSYFTRYAQELLEDCGDLPRDLPHYIEIDWEATARNIRVDYTSIEFDGNTFWYR